MIPPGVAHAALAGAGGADVVGLCLQPDSSADRIVMIPDPGSN